MDRMTYELRQSWAALLDGAFQPMLCTIPHRIMTLCVCTCVCVCVAWVLARWCAFAFVRNVCACVVSVLRGCDLSVSCVCELCVFAVYVCSK
jgi:hypothetical protein